MELGCTDGGCPFRDNKGQVTNGGCNCIRIHAEHTPKCWAVPVPIVQMMVRKAVAVALERHNATHEPLPTRAIIGQNFEGEKS